MSKSQLTEAMLQAARTQATTLGGLKTSLDAFLGGGARAEAMYLTASLLMEKYPLKTFSDTREIRHYNDGIYHDGSDSLLETDIEYVWGQSGTKHIRNEIVEHVRCRTFTKREEFNKKEYVSLQNGVLELSTMNILPCDQVRPFTYALPVKYDAAATCPNIDKFLSDVLRPEDVPTAYEIVGYCMLNGYPIQKAVMLFGGGNNGKSTFLEMVKRFLGGENVSSVSLQYLCEDPRSAGLLYGKLANVYADLGTKALYETGVFKILTGGDTLTVDVKYAQPMTFSNTAKLLFSANEYPSTLDSSDAFYRRWLILPFDRTFTDADVDLNIIDKITTPEELSGLLNKAVDALKRLLEKKKFTSAMSIDETRDMYILYSDSVGAFIMSCIESGDEEDFFIHKEDVIRAYYSYVKQRKMRRESEVWFWRKFRERVDYRTGRDDSRKQVLKGIKLKSDIVTIDSAKVKGVFSHCLKVSENIFYNNREIPCLPWYDKTVSLIDEFGITYENLFVLAGLEDEELQKILRELLDKGMISEPKHRFYVKVDK